MRRTGQVIAVALVLCMIAVACGDDDDSARPPGDDAGESILADLQAAALVRLVTLDNSFGDADPFDTINPGTLIGGDSDRPLQPDALDQVETELEAFARVIFVADVEASITKLFDQNTLGTAVASIEDLRIDGDRAELDMRLWCGALCGVFLTYEAELTDGGWEILGTTGPIAMS